MRDEGVGKSDYLLRCELLGVEPNHALSPRQRQDALPAWLSAEIISTPAAREKLRTFGRRHLEPQPIPSAADVLAQAWCLGGDEIMATALARTLVDPRIPPPVRSYALERCTFIGIGGHVAGFCGSADLTPPDGMPRPRLVVLAAHKPFDALVAHELAHCWTLPEPDATSRNGSTVWQSALYDASLWTVPGALMDEVIDRRRGYARDEDLAERLAARWGFGPVFDLDGSEERSR